VGRRLFWVWVSFGSCVIVSHHRRPFSTNQYTAELSRWNPILKVQQSAPHTPDDGCLILAQCEFNDQQSTSKRREGVHDRIRENVYRQRITGRLRHINSILAFKYAFRCHVRVSPICDSPFLDTRTDQAKGATIEGRVEMMERDFRTGNLVSYYSTFSVMEAPCTVTRYMRSVDQDRILLFDQQSENARRHPTTRPWDLNKSPWSQFRICDVKAKQR
jgi:hypothetical protein